MPFARSGHLRRTIANETPPHTGSSRCFPFWQEVLACYVVNTNSDDMSGKKKCAPVLEDYYECLHHKKEVRRPRTLRHQTLSMLTSPSLGCPRGFDTSGIQEARSSKSSGQRAQGWRNKEPGLIRQGGGHQERFGNQIDNNR